MYIKVKNIDYEDVEVKAFKIVNNWYVTRPLQSDLKYQKGHWLVTHKPTGRAALSLEYFTPNNKRQLEILRKYFMKYNLGSERYSNQNLKPEIVAELKSIFDELIYEMTNDDNVEFYVAIKTTNN